MDAALADAAEGDAGAEDAGADSGASDAALDVEDSAFDADLGPCGALTAIARASELDALTPPTWGTAAFVSERSLSGDLEASAAFEIRGSDFSLPSDCATPACGESVQVVVRGSVPGVVRAGTSVSIDEGAVFRLRFDVPFLPPAGQFATVTVENACRTDCGESELRCPEDSSCYGAGRDSCLACDHEPPARCACVGADGDLADGTDCFYVSGDIAIAGRCLGGSCN